MGMPGGKKAVGTDAFLAIPGFGVALALAGRTLFPNQGGGGSGRAHKRASVSDTDLARSEQGGVLTIGSPRNRTSEGKKISSFGLSGLRIPGAK